MVEDMGSAAFESWNDRFYWSVPAGAASVPFTLFDSRYRFFSTACSIVEQLKGVSK
jgi:hypothetical protein